MGKVDPSLRALAGWYGRQKRVLPWRENPAPYRVWISEIMLQQTQVAAVIPFFERFLNRFPDVHALAKAPLDDVLLAWAGLGYYSRARNLWASAKILSKNGFPETRDGWCELPGIGPYTAGAIASIAQNQVAPILDGNVERVISRFRGVGRSRGDTVFKKRLWRLSEWSVTRAKQLGIAPRDHNQALMELGALICTPKSPSCRRCPLSKNCRALETGKVSQYPPAKKKKQWILLNEERYLVVDSKGRFLVAQNPVGEWRAGLWDLVSEKPSGKRLGVIETKHVVTRHKITRRTSVYRLGDPKWKLLKQKQLKWVGPEDPIAASAALAKVIGRAKIAGFLEA